MQVDAINVRLENKMCFENKGECVRKLKVLYHNTKKEASTVLCSAVKHLGSGWSTQEVGRNTRLRLVFSPTLLSCSSNKNIKEACCVLYLTNRFHFAVRLYSDNAQMTSKRGENKEVRYEPQASSVTDVLTTF